MKKIITIIIVIFSFALVTNAKETLSIESFDLEKDIKVKAIDYEIGKGAYWFLALGEEYECTSTDYAGDTCNVWEISLNGKVSKYDKYYNPDSFYTFAGWEHWTVTKEGTKLRTVLNGEMMYPSKEAAATWVGGPGTVTHYIYEDLSFTYLKCIESDTLHETTMDYCEVGYEKNGNTIYGIISSEGPEEDDDSFVLDGDSKYSLVFEEGQGHSNFAVLQDSNNYYIVSANGKVETMKKSFLSGEGIDIKNIVLIGYDANTNYYGFTGTPCPPGQVCPQVVSNTIFTKDKIIASFSDTGGYSIEFIDETPYIVSYVYLNDMFSSASIYKLNKTPIVENVDDLIIGDDMLFYVKDGKFYATDMNKSIDIKLPDGVDTLNLLVHKPKLGNGNQSAYLFETAKYITPYGENFNPKYYIVTRTNEGDETPTPTPIPDDEEETPKYVCKKVNGKFYDKDGKEVSKTDYENSCPEKVPDTGYIAPIIVISLLGAGFIVINKKHKLLNRI